MNRWERLLDALCWLLAGAIVAAMAGGTLGAIVAVVALLMAALWWLM